MPDSYLAGGAEAGSAALRFLIMRMRGLYVNTFEKKFLRFLPRGAIRAPGSFFALLFRRFLFLRRRDRKHLYDPGRGRSDHNDRSRSDYDAEDVQSGRTPFADGLWTGTRSGKQYRQYLSGAGISGRT